MWWDLAAVGLGGGLSLTPMIATAMATVRSQRAGMVSAIHNSMGQALGVAVLGSLVYAGASRGSAGGGRLHEASAASFVDGLHRPVAVSGGCLLLAAALAMALIPAGVPAHRAPGGP